MSKIGYIRVSTEHQETARQQEIMSGYHVDRIFSEKLSGKTADRPQLKAMLDYVREGDTLYVESISRLGRSTSTSSTQRALPSSVTKRASTPIHLRANLC